MFQDTTPPVTITRTDIANGVELRTNQMHGEARDGELSGLEATMQGMAFVAPPTVTGLTLSYDGKAASWTLVACLDKERRVMFRDLKIIPAISWMHTMRMAWELHFQHGVLKDLTQQAVDHINRQAPSATPSEPTVSPEDGEWRYESAEPTADAELDRDGWLDKVTEEQSLTRKQAECLLFIGEWLANDPGEPTTDDLDDFHAKTVGSLVTRGFIRGERLKCAGYTPGNQYSLTPLGEDFFEAFGFPTR